MLDRSSGEVFMPEYLEQQKLAAEDAANYRNISTSYKNQFSDKEWYYYNYLVTGEITGDAMAEYQGAENEETESTVAGEETLTSQTTARPGVSFKYVLLGMVLFAFVYAGVIFMKYVLNNKIRGTDSLLELYNISQMGLIPGQEPKSKPFDFIDRWLLSMRDRNKRKYTRTEAEGLATTAIRLSVEQSGSDSVVLMGCNLEGQALTVCEQMKEVLGRDNIHAKILDNVIYDKQAMSSLEHEKCAVLVEQAGSTRYEEIAQELELLERQGIRVLGGIIVEG